MGTAISRTLRTLAGLAALAAALLLAACSGTTNSVSSGSGAFAWLHPAAPPSSWHVAVVSNHATLPYPPAWRLIHGDPGTASAALFDGGRQPPGFRDLRGYLNLTPQGPGEETLSGWARFRATHDAEEGDREVRTIAAASGLRFRGGHGSCVRDAYATPVGTRYVEIACLIAGARGRTVVVAAAPPGSWAAVAPAMQRAISGVNA